MRIAAVDGGIDDEFAVLQAEVVCLAARVLDLAGAEGQTVCTIELAVAGSVGVFLRVYKQLVAVIGAVEQRYAAVLLDDKHTDKLLHTVNLHVGLDDDGVVAGEKANVFIKAYIVVHTEHGVGGKSHVAAVFRVVGRIDRLYDGVIFLAVKVGLHLVVVLVSHGV